MTKARRRSAGLGLGLGLGLALGVAAPTVAAADPAGDWEPALQKCMPGAPFDTCVAALEAAKLPLRKQDTTYYNERGFELQAPLGDVTVRTYKKAAGKIVSVRVTMIEPKGKGRKDVLTWLKKQIGSTAKQGRGGTGSAEGCGADGWGVGWVAGKAEDPEVQLQLHSPESTSSHDDPAKLKPEDALLKRAGDDVVVLCFVLPNKPSSVEYIDAPVIAPATLQAFLASPLFHGKAKLK